MVRPCIQADLTPPELHGEATQPFDSLVQSRPPDVSLVVVNGEIVNEINAGLPADTWENVPTDGSINLGHYLYGAPKRQP